MSTECGGGGGGGGVLCTKKVAGPIKYGILCTHSQYNYFSKNKVLTRNVWFLFLLTEGLNNL